MITAEDVEDTWRVLADVGASGDELRVRELPDLPDGADGVLFALDALGSRHVLMEVGRQDAVVEDRRSSGVHLVRHRLLDAGQTRVFVDLFCRKPHLHAAFSHLVCEVLATWNHGLRRPDESCTEVLERWRELLERGPSDTLGAEQRLGLFGELFTLREIVRRDPRAFGRWKGPFGWRHDFTDERLAIEVKTIGVGEWRCEINGLEQLVPPTGGELFLFVLKVERDAGGESLEDLVEGIVAAGVSRSALTSVLETAGCRFPPNAADEPRSRVVAIRAYPVNARFPRLVPGDLVDGQLRSGVLKVRYQLDLGDVHVSPLDESVMGNVLDRISGSTR